MPTVNETLRDRYISHQIYLRRVGTSIVHEIIKVLNQADKELIGRLNARLAVGKTHGFTTQRLKALVNELRVANLAAYGAVRKKLEGELIDLADYEATFTQNLIQDQLDGLSLPLALTGISPQTLKAVVTATPFQGKLLGQHISDQARRRMRLIRGVTQQGIVQGLTNDEMIQRIRGTRALKYRDGILEISRHEAETLARTGVAAVTGEARDELYRANADIVEGERWEAILDGRTTLICIRNDGSTRSLDPDTGQWSSWSNGYAGGYPAHWNERSTLVPTLRSYQELGLDKNAVQDDPKVVHTSRVAKTRRQVRKDVRAELRNEDPAAWSALTPAQRQRRLTKAVRQRYADLAGEVPAGTTYPTWLEKQPRAFVDEVLGPTRAEAFLSGKLSIDRFTDDFGKPLTILEMGLIERVESPRKLGATMFRAVDGSQPKALDLPEGASVSTAVQRAMSDLKDPGDYADFDGGSLDDLHDIEDLFADQPRAGEVEFAAVFDSARALRFVMRGREGSVPVGTHPRADAILRGGTLTHNHPNGAAFSEADFTFSVARGLGEIRAVARSAKGSGTDYSLKPSPDWPKLSDADIVSVYLEIERVASEVRRKHPGNTAADREIGIALWREELSAVWDRLAERFGLRYRAVRRRRGVE